MPARSVSGKDISVIFVKEFCRVWRLPIFLYVGHNSRIPEEMDFHILLPNCVRVDSVFVCFQIALHVLDKLFLGESPCTDTNPIIRKELRECGVILLF